MDNTILCVVACLILCSSAFAQEQPRALRGGGHLLGETAKQFFSEGFAGDMQRACAAKDWKTMSQLSKSVGHASKSSAKDYCARETLAEQQASSGKRLEYNGHGDEETMRTDTFTFDGGHLVKMDMVYDGSVRNIEGYRPKSFSELFDGLREAYGPPSKSYSQPVLNVYGVKYDAHRALWLGKQDAISIIEQPGEDGRTEIIAQTLAEYNRSAQAPKTANPLH
jgi:hypothetical protein